MLPINLTAVVVAALVAFVLGFLFHGPVLGSLWMRLANIHPTGNEKFSDMLPQMLWSIVINLIAAFVLAGILAFSALAIGPATWERGAILGAWLWLGFNATATVVDVIWMGKSFKLWLFEAVASLVVIAAMGAILGGW